MSKANETTLGSYEGHVQEYIDGTPQEVLGDVKSWIDRTLEVLPPDTRIIEVGSAFGRDANYIEGLGYSVEWTDATQGFVDWLNANSSEARAFNLITDDFNGQYDLVFADAVLLHFFRDEMTQVLPKIQQALTPNGRFSFSLKQGEGEGWSDTKLGTPRFLCYWNRD